MKEVIMPKFGFTQETAEIVRWLKRAGEAVEQGDPVAEVTTDKVNMEVEAPATGILDGLRFKEGDTVPVTHVIAWVRGANEAIPGEASGVGHQAPVGATVGASGEAAARPDAPTVSGQRPTAGEAKATPLAAKVAADLGVDPATVAGTGVGGKVTRSDVQAAATAPAASRAPEGKVAASPAARRVARELGVDLHAVSGSGPRGRIQSDDVRAAERAATRAAPTADQSTTRLPDHATTRLPLAGMRRTIATRLQKSFQEAPHVFFEAQIDVTAAEALRAKVNGRLAKDAARVSLTVVIAKACAWALARHPLVNSHLVGAPGQEEIVMNAVANIGIAVALEAAPDDPTRSGGLIVPVVRGVGDKGLEALAADIADVSKRARGNKLRPDDVSDGTFTISNLGMFGVDRFTAIINPPQVAILAVSAARKQFVPDADGNPVVRPIMAVTLSADHRVVDGAVAARFLADLRAVLEDPALMLA